METRIGMLTLRRTKFLLLVLVIAGLFLYTAQPACAPQRMVRVGVYDCLPLCRMSPEASGGRNFTRAGDGEEGLFIDLIRHIALREGWDLTFVPGSIDECFQRLDSDEIDILVAASLKKELASRYGFSKETILSTWAQVYTAGGKEIQSWFDLSSKCIGLVKGDPYNPELRSILKNFDIRCRFVEFNDYKDVFHALESGWIDAGVVDRLYAFLHEGQYPVRRSSIVFSPIELRFAAPSGRNADLLTAIDYHVGLEKGRSDSFFNKLIDGAFGAKSTPIVPPWVRWGLLVVLGLLVIFGVMSWVLRRQVTKKTGELTRKNQELEREVLMRRSAEQALLQTQNKFKALFEFAPESIFLLEIGGSILDCNIAAEKMTGYRRQELRGISADGLLAVDAPGRLSPAVVKDRDGGEVSTEVSCRRKNEELFPARVVARSLELDDSEILLVMVRELTEQKKMEKELLKIQKLESLGILAGGIAHDFNNILCAILGNISLALMLHKQGRQIPQKLLEGAEVGAVRATDLTQQLLTFSKGGTPVKKTASVTAVVRESCDFVLRGANLRCDYDLPPDVRAAEIDVGQISQVVSNIVINAKQAMPEGGALLVRARNVEIGHEFGALMDPGKYVEITIRDHGPGIAKEHLSKIFDPFFTTKSSGSGLGLATSYSIVKKHGGHVSAESEVGVGTAFHVFLPASEKEIPSRERQEGTFGGTERILFMDDEEAVRRATGEMLHHIGCHASFAGDGDEAVRIYRESLGTPRPFDAVIMDLTIPGGVGGREAVRKLLDIDPEARVIATTGYSNDPVMADHERYGFAAAIPKPFGVADLARVLREVVKGRREEAEPAFAAAS